jgi:uncharacterized membrane-anchored protein
MQFYTEYTISLLLIKSNHNITIEVRQLDNPIMEYLRYYQYDYKERPKDYWTIVLLVSKAESQVPDNMGLHNPVPLLYQQFLLLFEKKTVDVLDIYYLSNHTIDLKYGKYLS